MGNDEIEKLKEEFKSNLFQIEKLLGSYNNRIKDVENKCSKIKETNGKPIVKNDEVERLKEKFKLNFFQIEKLLRAYDERINSIEKKDSLIKETDKKVNIIKKDSADLKNSFKKTNKRVENKIEDFESIAKENKKVIIEIEKEMGVLHKDFLAKTKNLEDIFNKKVLAMNSSSLATEKKMVEFTKTRMAELYKQLTTTISKKESEFKEMENSINKKIKRVDALGSKLPKIESNVEIFNKNYQDWKIFSIGLEEDKKLYLELRKVVLDSIEKLKNLENVFNQNLEEFEEINNRIEGNEKTYKEMSEKTKNEMVRLDEKSNNLETSIEEYKIKLKDRLTKRFEELNSRLENEVKVKLIEQDNLISNYGSKFTEMEQKFKELENEVIPKKIDKEFNEMLVILRDKLKDLVTLNEFEKIRGELRTKIEQVRMPEITPVEKRIDMIESDLEEVKILLRGLSQRLPVVLE
ncbi:MAG: hypothetical protein DRP06_02880 [Candidatus Aenigmatarchaeota archaeon]|nr:MAG: hypothetical protein DRP06_02880 [Candidatus Aenigmarchaeota archaeon]